MATKIKPVDDVVAASGAGLVRVGSAVDAAGLKVVRGAVSKQQVRLRTSKRFKLIVVAVTFFAALCDFMGTVIVMPMLPPLCVMAPGGPFSTESILKTANFTCASTSMMTCADQETAVVAAVKASPEVTSIVSPLAFTDLSLPFSTSVELPMAIGQYFSAIGSLCAGSIVDKVGAKIPILVCLAMGLVGYAMMYLAGMESGSYWMFAGGLWINQLFGVVTDIASTYVGKLFADNPKERDVYVSLITTIALLGATVGAFVVMPFASGNGANTFYAIWVAIGLTVLAIVLVLFVLVNPPKDDGPKKEVPKTPKAAQKLLIVTAIASCLDSGGDVGTQMARSTILMGLFPNFGTTSMQNILLLVVIGVAIGAFAILGFLKKFGFNQASIATIGSIATLVAQILLASNAYMDSEAGYIILWHCGKLFGFLSTFSSGLMIAQIAPTENLGFWNGMNGFLTNVCVGTSQIIFSRVYDSFNDGSRDGQRGTQMLIATSIISFLSVLAYGSLIPLWPKDVDEKAQKKKDDDYADFAKWDALSDREFSLLPMETVNNVNMTYVKSNKPPRVVTWGDYTAERADLLTMNDRASVDFKYFSGFMREMLADRTKMLEMQKHDAEWKKIVPAVDRAKAKTEMGAWLADYFDDAGYQDWEKMAPMYKAMFMNAFPPIDALDDVKPDYATMPIDDFEDSLMKMLQVMDDHVTVKNKRFSYYKSINALVSGVLQRR
jgi:MFS family permease